MGGRGNHERSRNNGPRQARSERVSYPDHADDKLEELLFEPTRASRSPPAPPAMAMCPWCQRRRPAPTDDSSTREPPVDEEYRQRKINEARVSIEEWNAAKLQELPEGVRVLIEHKPYMSKLMELTRKTSFRLFDLDTRALTLLDVMEETDNAQSALNHLRNVLVGVTRSEVANWRGYIYSVLRAFDPDAYARL